MLARRLPRDGQGLEARRPQILVEHACAGADHVDRPRYGKRRDRQAARQRFDEHDPECVGARGEDEHVGARIDVGQRFALLCAEKMRVRIAALKMAARRSVADDDSRARQVEIEQRLEVLFHRDPTDRQEDRPRQVERALRPRTVEGVIDAARP